MVTQEEVLVERLRKTRARGISRRQLAELSEGQLTEAQLGRIELSSGPRPDEVAVLQATLDRVDREKIQPARRGPGGVTHPPSATPATPMFDRLATLDVLRRAKRARTDARRRELIDVAIEQLEVTDPIELNGDGSDPSIP